MLCSGCNVLSYTYNEKICIKCKGKTSINIAILCDDCSNKDQSCAICLKKAGTSLNNNKTSGCRCGSR